MSTFNLDWQVDTSQIDKLVSQLQATKDKAEAAATALDGVEVTVKKTTAATHEFSLANAGVVRELSVMMGEAMRGNWSRLEGSMTVLANRTGLMAMAFTPLGAAIGATAGAIGLLAIAAHQGAEQQHRLEVALTMTGNAAGSTAGRLIDAAHAAGEASGNLSGAKQAVEKLTESGRFSEGQVQSFGATIAQVSRVTGEKVDKMAESFIKLSDRPLNAAMDLNKQYHFLTAAVVKHIAELERQGRADEAGALAAQTFSDAMKKRADETVQNLGYMALAANAAGQGFAWMWEKISGIGRKDTIQEQIDKALTALTNAQARQQRDGFRGRGTSQADAAAAEAQATLAALQAAQHDEQKFAGMDGSKRAEEDGKVHARAWLEAHHKEFMTKAQRYKEEEDEFIRNARTDGMSEADIQKGLAGFRSNHKDASRNADNNRDIEALRGKIEQEKVLHDLGVTNLKTALASRQITQEQFDKQKEALDLKELDEDIRYAQQAQAIAEKKGKNFEAEAQHWRNQAEKFLSEKKLKQAEEVQAEATHADNIRKAQEASLLQADKYNNTRIEALRKANRQLFMSAEERSAADARDAIEVHYQSLIDQEIKKLDDLHASHDQVTAAVDKLNLKRKEAIDAEEAQFEQRKKLEGDWVNGAKLAFKKYQEEAANVSSQTEKLFTSAFSKMEDSLVNLVSTGKLNFKSLASSIISDIIRMEIRAQESKVLGYLGSAFGFGSTPSASGSVMDAGSSALSLIAASGMAFGNGVPGMYADGTVVGGPRFFAGGAGLMGEAGPEAIMPLTRGADGKLGVQASGAGGGVTVHGGINVTVQGGITNEQTGQIVAQAVQASLAHVPSMADKQIANSWRQNGLSYNASRA